MKKITPINVYALSLGNDLKKENLQHKFFLTNSEPNLELINRYFNTNFSVMVHKKVTDETILRNVVKYYQKQIPVI